MTPTHETRTEPISPNSRGRTDWLWPISAVAATLLGFMPRLTLLLDVVYARDAYRMHYPVQSWISQRLRSGELPMWFPYEGLGVPLLQSAVAGALHPYALLHFFLDPAHVVTVATVLSAGLAVSGAYAFTRVVGADPPGATLAGLAYGMAGAVVSSYDNLTFLIGAAALPVFFTGLHLATARTRGILGAVLGSGALAFTLLAGDIQAVYVAGWLGVAYALTVAPVGGRWRALGITAGVGLLAVGLSAVQLLPTIHVLGAVERAQGYGWDIATRWSLHPLRVPELFIGDLTRYVPGDPAAGHLFGWEGRAPWNLTVFGGTVTGLAVLWAAVLRKRVSTRLVAVLLVGAAALLLVALGRYGGLYAVMHRVLPLWDAFRYPEKMVVPTTLLLAVLAGLGFTAARRDPRRALRLALLWMGGSAGAAAFVSLLSGVMDGWLAALTNAPVESVARYLDALGLGLVRSAGVALLVAAVLFVVVRRPERHPILRLTTVLLLLVHFVDLTSENQRALSMITADADIFRAPSRLADTLHEKAGPSLGRYRLTTIVHAYRTIPFPEVEARDGASYIGTMAWQRQALFPDISALDGIETALPYLPTGSHALAERTVGREARWVVQEAPLYNVRFLVTDSVVFEKIGWGSEQSVAALPDFDLMLAEYPVEVLPRAFLASPQLISPDFDFDRGLAEPDVRAGRVALVEVGVEATEASPPAAARGHAAILSYAPEEVRIRAVVKEGPAVLVLNDSFYPGWSARVDGKPIDILRTNALVRGVLLEAGHHEVVFRYDLGWWWTGGLVISLLSVVVVAGLLVLVFRRSWLARTSVR